MTDFGRGIGTMNTDVHRIAREALEAESDMSWWPDPRGDAPRASGGLPVTVSLRHW